MRWSPTLVALVILAGCDYVFRLDMIADPPAPDAPVAIVGRWSEVAAGFGHTCAIDNAGALFCWGRNNNGEVGIASNALQIDTPTQVGAATWRLIETGDRTTCGIQTDGSLWCWGAAGEGQTGTGTTNRRAPELVSAGPWRTVSVDLEHGCAIREDDASLWCWGRNDDSEVGDGTTMLRDTPVAIAPTMQWLDVAAGQDTTCAIAIDGSRWCWGQNDRGQFGTETPTTAAEPIQIGTETWTQVDVGNNFGCGITDGEVRCWGENGFGELGDATTALRKTPGPIASERRDFIELTIQRRSTCARTQDGHVLCWGVSTRGQLGVEQDVVSLPAELTGEVPWKRVAVGYTHACAIGIDDALWCAGMNSTAQLGDASANPRTPTQVPGAWTEVQLGFQHTCARDPQNGVHCAGFNQSGQLGIGSVRAQQTMTAIGLSADRLALGQNHSCALTGDMLWCWGANFRGQLGTGTMQDALSPRELRSAKAATAHQHTCSLEGAGTAVCWGDNEYGQLGNGMMSSFETMPKAIEAFAWRALAAGRRHTCGVADSATREVRCWGSGAQIGDNGDPNVLVLSPTSNGVTDVDELAAGGYHTCARSGEAVRCWGAGYAGQLGLGDNAARLTPAILIGTWRTIGAGNEHSCGIKTDGTLWCWGNNARGQLGTGTVQSTLSPVQVGTATNWKQVACFESHTCAVNATSELYCWGDNTEGQLALGNAWRSTFAQVP